MTDQEENIDSKIIKQTLKELSIYLVFLVTALLG